MTTLEQRDSCAVLTLRRQAVHNAISPAVADEIEAHLDTLDASPGIRVLIVTGEGPTFCAGADLGYFTELAGDRREGLAFCQRMASLLDRLASGPRTVIAALDGNALGGGCELALACHLRIAAPDICFSFRQAVMGVITGWGGGARLFTLVGRSTALRWLLSAATINAEEAKQHGLVDFLAEDNALMEALCLGERIAQQSSVSTAAFLELAQDPSREAELFARCWLDKDFPQRLEDRQKTRRDKAHREKIHREKTHQERET